MKAILSIALVLGFCGLADAQGEKADPVGTWKCEYEIGGQKRMSTLTIKKDGDKLAGTMSWSDQKETNLKDLKLKDGTLMFTAERKFMDNTFTVEYKLTIDGDKLTGKGAAEVGGELAAVEDPAAHPIRSATMAAIRRSPSSALARSRSSSALASAASGSPSAR